MFGAVIFDFDGVIVDSEPLHYRAIQAALATVGLGFGYDEYLARYVGFDDRDVFREALRAAGQAVAEDRVAALCRLKAAAFRHLLDGDIPAVAGAAPLIRELAAQGVPLAVASGALEAEIRFVLGRLGLTDCFSVVVSSDQVAVSKPDPATYRLAVERLTAAFPNRGIRAGACLAIEDTACGVASARGAGLRVLALTTTTTALDLAGADWVRPDLSGVSAEDILADQYFFSGAGSPASSRGFPEEDFPR